MEQDRTLMATVLIAADEDEVLIKVLWGINAVVLLRVETDQGLTSKNGYSERPSPRVRGVV